MKACETPNLSQSESLAAKLQLKSTVLGLFSVRYAIPSPISKSKSLWCQFSDLCTAVDSHFAGKFQLSMKEYNKYASRSTCKFCDHVRRAIGAAMHKRMRKFKGRLESEPLSVGRAARFHMRNCKGVPGSFVHDLDGWHVPEISKNFNVQTMTDCSDSCHFPRGCFIGSNAAIAQPRLLSYV